MLLQELFESKIKNKYETIGYLIKNGGWLSFHNNIPMIKNEFYQYQFTDLKNDDFNSILRSLYIRKNPQIRDSIKTIDINKIKTELSGKWLPTPAVKTFFNKIISKTELKHALLLSETIVNEIQLTDFEYNVDEIINLRFDGSNKTGKKINGYDLYSKSSSNGIGYILADQDNPFLYVYITLDKVVKTFFIKKDYQRKGLGISIYKWLLNRFGELRSDTSQTAGAKMTYRSLIFKHGISAFNSKDQPIITVEDFELCYSTGYEYITLKK